MDTHDSKQTERKEPRDEGDDTSNAAVAPERQRSTASKRTAAKKTAPRVSENNVRKLRTERMMSKAELARRAGLSTLTIDRVEKGFPCRMDTKRKILEALGLTPSDRVAVFGEED
ncbi:MAG: hypothetical protein CSA65_04605 [Proteobacteria bacterium]|nr:MAG: hypothetical protein CSB49_02935 [Pseudomonadota bacterium]PIE18569.1 MAG: hypothetical protein CSA65_04605 [Pseudomonadota bacterium]